MEKFDFENLKSNIFGNFDIFREKYFFEKKNQLFENQKISFGFLKKLIFSRKIFFSKNLKISKNFRFQIFKIKFLHEKLIFFLQIFFPGKVWLCTSRKCHPESDCN